MNIIKNTKVIQASLILLAGIAISQGAYAETAVIVNSNNTSDMSSKDVQRIYLGKLKSFPGGEQAIPVDQEKGRDNREAFFDKIIDKSESQLKSYWSRLVFTGKGTPPREVGDSVEVMKIVSSNPNTIGYVDTSVLDDSVRVVLKF